MIKNSTRAIIFFKLKETHTAALIAQQIFNAFIK